MLANEITARPCVGRPKAFAGSNTVKIMMLTARNALMTCSLFTIVSVAGTAPSIAGSESAARLFHLDPRNLPG